jgi:hypothetical protein
MKSMCYEQATNGVGNKRTRSEPDADQNTARARGPAGVTFGVLALTGFCRNDKAGALPWYLLGAKHKSMMR